MSLCEDDRLELEGALEMILGTQNETNCSQLKITFGSLLQTLDNPTKHNVLLEILDSVAMRTQTPLACSLLASSSIRRISGACRFLMHKQMNQLTEQLVEVFANEQMFHGQGPEQIRSQIKILVKHKLNGGRETMSQAQMGDITSTQTCSPLVHNQSHQSPACSQRNTPSRVSSSPSVSAIDQAINNATNQSNYASHIHRNLVKTESSPSDSGIAMNVNNPHLNSIGLQYHQSITNNDLPVDQSAISIGRQIHHNYIRDLEQMNSRQKHRLPQSINNQSINNQSVNNQSINNESIEHDDSMNGLSTTRAILDWLPPNNSGAISQLGMGSEPNTSCNETSSGSILPLPQLMDSSLIHQQRQSPVKDWKQAPRFHTQRKALNSFLRRRTTLPCPPMKLPPALQNKKNNLFQCRIENCGFKMVGRSNYARHVRRAHPNSLQGIPGHIL